MFQRMSTFFSGLFDAPKEHNYEALSSAMSSYQFDWAGYEPSPERIDFVTKMIQEGQNQTSISAPPTQPTLFDQVLGGAGLIGIFGIVYLVADHQATALYGN